MIKLLFLLLLKNYVILIGIDVSVNASSCNMYIFITVHLVTLLKPQRVKSAMIRMFSTNTFL